MYALRMNPRPRIGVERANTLRQSTQLNGWVSGRYEEEGHKKKDLENMKDMVWNPVNKPQTPVRITSEKFLHAN